MASAKLRAAQAEQLEDLKMDMSPMIDMVFLLLIFFMVASNLLVVRIDQRVKPPTAKNAEVAKVATGRIVVNILDDGTITDVDKKVLESSDAITEYVDRMRLETMESDNRPRLHLRADKNVETRHIKKVVQAAAAAEVVDVIFATFVVEVKD